MLKVFSDKNTLHIISFLDLLARDFGLGRVGLIGCIDFVGRVGSVDRWVTMGRVRDLA